MDVDLTYFYCDKTSSLIRLKFFSMATMCNFFFETTMCNYYHKVVCSPVSLIPLLLQF